MPWAGKRVAGRGAGKRGRRLCVAVPVSGSKERREAVEKSVVRAALVTESVTRVVMKLQAISGGGGGRQEAGGDSTANESEEQASELAKVLKIVVNADGTG